MLKWKAIRRRRRSSSSSSRDFIAIEVVCMDSHKDISLMDLDRALLITVNNNTTR
jgi:hypothetical protein